jgi:hypothetical protein
MFIRYGSLSGTFIGILSLLALTLITIIAFAMFKGRRKNKFSQNYVAKKCEL